MDDHLSVQAAHNNAAWCDLVCRAHGLATRMLDGLWVNPQPGPRYYPNAITLDPHASEVQLHHLRQLAAHGPPGGWGVKDSFAALDLGPLGFQPGFDAAWLHVPTAQALPPASSEHHWQRVTTPDDLAAWEAAWSADEPPGLPHVFLPPLLNDPDVAFLASRDGDRIVAGVIANRSAEVVGVSNLFLPARASLAMRASAVAAAAAAFPGLPLVGYDRGDDLAEMLAIGFRAIGPLRVWFKTLE